MRVVVDRVRVEDTAPILDVCFESGTCNVLLGRNAAGKSALCRMVAGLESPAAGSVAFGEPPVVEPPLRDRPVALVYQAFVNYPSLTVFENIASPLRAASRSDRLSGAEITRRVQEAAECVAISDQLTKRPAELSGGQQQRVAIARALAKRAPVVVLDEPLVNLDFKLREALRSDLKAVFKSLGTTVIYATSDPVEALEIADVAFLMHQGAILQQGPVLELYTRPVSLAAADLLSDPGVNRLDPSTAVRPEHLRPGPGCADDLTVTGVVELTETDGSSTFVHLQVDERPWVARLPGLHRFAGGQHLTLYVAQANVLACA